MVFRTAQRRAWPSAVVAWLVHGCAGDNPQTPPVDMDAPAAVTDLRVVSAWSDSMRLAWTAPGDDGATGTARQYDIRYSTSDQIRESNWSMATPVPGEPSPGAGGASDSMTVAGLSPSTRYWFALKTADEVPNWSWTSNSPGRISAPPPMRFVRVEPGTFTMGSPASEPGRYQNEVQHPVTLTRAFYLSDHEVTQAEWFAVMGWNESSFRGDSLPVETITWFDCLDFCNRKSQASGLQPAYSIADLQMDGNHIVGATVNWNAGASGYRLPTEAEWEYACRSGTQTAFCNGEITVIGCGVDPNLTLVGWYCGNAGGTTHAVRGKSPNAWGLYDMHGNVYEWCWDWFDVYPVGAVTDPVGPVSGGVRILRSGRWKDDALLCRAACRGGGWPGYRSFLVGLRLTRPAL